MDIVRKLLRYEFTIAELIGLAALAVTPYLVIGVIWALTHTDRLAGLHGVRIPLSVIATVLAWPVLLLGNACPV